MGWGLMSRFPCSVVVTGLLWGTLWSAATALNKSIGCPSSFSSESSILATAAVTRAHAVVVSQVVPHIGTVHGTTQLCAFQSWSELVAGQSNCAFAQFRYEAYQQELNRAGPPIFPLLRLIQMKKKNDRATFGNNQTIHPHRELPCPSRQEGRVVMIPSPSSYGNMKWGVCVTLSGKSNVNSGTHTKNQPKYRNELETCSKYILIIQIF